MSKRYIMTFADATEANALIAENPDAYAPGTLCVTLTDGKVFVSHSGAWTLVGSQA